VRHVLARRCTMTESESARVSPSGAARVDGVSTRLFERLRPFCAQAQSAISPKAREAPRGATDRRLMNEPPAGELRGTQRIRPFLALLAHSACTRGAASSPAMVDAPRGCAHRARGRDHPVLASRPARPSLKKKVEKQGASSRRVGLQLRLLVCRYRLRRSRATTCGREG